MPPCAMQVIGLGDGKTVGQRKEVGVAVGKGGDGKSWEGEQ